MIISKGFYELPDLTNFFWSVIKKLNPLTTVTETSSDQNSNIFSLVVETVAQIGNQLLNTDPQQTETYFLEYAMDDLVEIVETNVFKRNDMMYLFYCFVSNTVNSHLRVLSKLKEKIQNKDAFYYCLSKLIVFENENTQELAPELYTFYFENAAYGLLCSSPVTRTKCVTILSSLSKTSIEPIVPLLQKLEVFANDSYWELKGQILILCANTLQAFNQISEDEEEDDEEKGPTLLEQNDNGELKEINPDDLASPGGHDDFMNGSQEEEEKKHFDEEMGSEIIREEATNELMHNESQNISKIETLN